MMRQSSVRLHKLCKQVTVSSPAKSDELDPKRTRGLLRNVSCQLRNLHFEVQPLFEGGEKHLALPGFQAVDDAGNGAHIVC